MEVKCKGYCGSIRQRNVEQLDTCCVVYHETQTSCFHVPADKPWIKIWILLQDVRLCAALLLVLDSAACFVFSGSWKRPAGRGSGRGPPHRHLLPLWHRSVTPVRSRTPSFRSLLWRQATVSHLRSKVFTNRLITVFIQQYCGGCLVRTIFIFILHRSNTLWSVKSSKVLYLRYFLTVCQ